MSWLTRSSTVRGIVESLGTEVPSCINCEYFSEEREVCHLDPLHRRPPARIIAKGCDSFEELVPF